MELKKLMAGEIRFIIKKVGSAFRVYDPARGSYPYSHPALGGTVKQDVPQKEAQEEADRLNKEFGSAPVAGSGKQKRGSKQKSAAAETVELDRPIGEVMRRRPVTFS